MAAGVDVWGFGFANMVWPWLAFAVLGIAAVMTIVTGVAPLRGLRSALSSLSGGRGRVTGREGQRALAIPLAAAAGMGGITGATLAVTAGGPGALPWMWIATALGMGLSFAEGALGSSSGADGRHPLWGKGAASKVLGPLYAAAIVAVALVAGGMLQTHEAAAILEETLWAPPATAGLGLAMVAIVFVFSEGARSLLFRLVPVVLLLFALSAATIAFADGMYLQMRIGDAFNAAFGLDAAAGGAAGGVVAVAIHHGVLRATMAGEAGLGTASLAGLRAERPGDAGALTMLVPPLTAGLLSTLSALVLLTAARPTDPNAAPGKDDAGADAKADDNADSNADANADAAPANDKPADVAVHEPSFAPVVAAKTTVPLERAVSRGLRPSQQVGQTVVLPEDAGLDNGEHYAVLLRSDPRGHTTAKFDPERNAVILPAWQVADDVDEIIFRAREKDRTKLAAWDVRIPCNREVRAPQPGGKEFLKLTPKDESLDLQRLVTRLRLSPQAYVPLGDFHFVGRVGQATTSDLGSHLAMFEPGRDDRPFNPKLHEFFRNGFRGPYADDGTPAPPFAFVAQPGYEPRIGSIVRLALQGHPRGEPFVSVTRAGNLEAPPWSFLLQARTVVIRHDTDPSKDVRIAVTPRYEEFRIMLDPADTAEHDFTKIPEGWNGPFVVVPNYEFEAEVRGDARLASTLKGRRTLIPVHATQAPQGPHGDTWPYAPHPADVLAAGMHGPTLAARGAATVAVRFRSQLGTFGTMSIVICTIVLALTTLVAWSQVSARAAETLVGASGAKVMPIAVLAAAAGGAWASLTQLVAVADVAMAVAVATNLIGLTLALPRIIEAGRDLGRKRS